MALVITLSLIVLVTIATMAFFARSMSNRALESSRSNQILAKQVADTGVDYVTGQFLQEIATNSAVITTNGIPIYSPNNATNAIPRRSISSAIPATDASFSNLLRGSYAGADPNASPDNTDTPSQNGRRVGTNRWNAPILLAGGGFTATNQLPNWIYLNRDGNPTNAASTNAIGRFAYTVYDVSGLLDVNVSGYPSSVAIPPTYTGTNLATIKSTLAGADLSQIPGITSATMNTFVQWRNTNSASSATSYVTNVSAAATNGFLTPRPGDRNLLSRQDLIKLAREGNGVYYGITTNALPYLTTFTRALNAPSWSPPLNASQMTPNYLDALKDTKDPDVRRNYANEANNVSAANRFLPNVRVSGIFTRADGTVAQVGEPLIKTRFPLSWLALLRDADPTTTAWETTPEATTILNNLNARRAANGQPNLTVPTLVQQAFGLTWNSSSGAWQYRADTIYRLDEVAQLSGANAREPDFFELLKAGILNGSLGKSTPADTAFVANFLPDRNKDLQILKIGANIIDQADPDDMSTQIVRPLANEIVLGIENHPYIYLMSQTHFRRKDISPDPAAGDPVTGNPMPYATCYQQMEVWNPHTNATATGRSYRIRALQGSSRISAAGIGRDGPLVTQQDLFIGFNGNQNFSEPTLLNKTNIDASRTSPGNMFWTTGNASNAILAGFLIGNIKLNNNVDGLTPDIPYDDYGPPNASAWLVITPQIPIIYQLEYSDGARWIPVQRTYPVKGTYGNGMWGGLMWTGGKGEIWDFTEIIYNGGKYPASAGPGLANTPYGTTMMLVACKTDPRVQRLGVFGAGGLPPDNNTMRRSTVPLKYRSGYPAWHTVDGMSWDCNTWNFLWRAIRPLPTLFSDWRNEPADATLDDLSDNRMDSPTLIADPDGVVRPADGTPRTNIPGVGSPARPVMLNRPFRSVGEMGYALRDDPWKTLDFSSAYSADAALLDLFSVTESPVGNVTAGVLNLNTRQQPVLKAVLAGALKNELNASSTLPATEADAIATAMIATTGATPLLNRAELATRIVTTGTTVFTDPNDADIKTRRESIVRALADVGNTRTWNLMIDLVAQSGRYGVAASSPDKFVVEGERRYWLHLAIDRYTGKVIARNLESVNE